MIQWPQILNEKITWKFLETLKNRTLLLQFEYFKLEIKGGYLKEIHVELGANKFLLQKTWMRDFKKYGYSCRKISIYEPLLSNDSSVALRNRNKNLCNSVRVLT